MAGARIEPRPSRPRGGAKLGVLPLALVGTDETETHLALGACGGDHLRHGRFRWIFLVSSSSIAQFVPSRATTPRCGARWGWTTCSTAPSSGSASGCGSRCRLVDLQDGSQVVWARRFDRQVDDLLSLQDEVAAEVVAQIDPEILADREPARRPNGALQQPTAYDLTLRAQFRA